MPTLFLSSCIASTPIYESEGVNFDGTRALELIQSQLAFGDRIPGSEGHEMVGDWITQELKVNGWEVEEQLFSYREFQGRNIIGMNEPTEGEWIILAAHYDTRPISDQQAEPWAPVPGANDGGSGVAVLLELARVLQNGTLNQQIWLVFFDLEDSGDVNGMEWIVGSTYFAEQLQELPDKVIIVDMVGDSDLQLYYENNSDPSLTEEIWNVAMEMGYKSFTSSGKYSMLDDHIPFVQKGIPAIDIIDFDYPYWHTTQDTLDKVSADSLEQVGRTLQRWLLSN